MIGAIFCALAMSATKIVVNPEVKSSAFNRSEGYNALVNKNLAVAGKESGISGFAKSANYYDVTEKTVKQASVSFVKSGTLVSDCIVTVYTIDSNGKASPLLGPVVATGSDFKNGYVLQPVITHDGKEYVCYFLHVIKERMTFSELRNNTIQISSVNNGGLLQPSGKELLQLETDYVLHAFVPEISSRGVMIWRQPLYCVPAGEEYYSCIPLLSFDIGNRTFSQVMVPDMLRGRTNKLQDPYYSITVDKENKRVVLVGVPAYNRQKVTEDEVYTYQYIPFDSKVWVNSVSGVQGLPSTEKSYITTYNPDLKQPNIVIFKVSTSSSRHALEKESKGRRIVKGDQDSSWERPVLFYQEASLSTQTIRTTTNGFYLGNNTVTVPWQIPNNWGIGGKYDTLDINAKNSANHGIRVIKIENKTMENITYDKDEIAAYLDLTYISKDSTAFSLFAKDCTVEFTHPPVFDEEGNAYFISNPLQVVYHCRQNFFAYQVKIPINSTLEEVDSLSMGPDAAAAVPLNEVFFIYDGDDRGANDQPSKQAQELLLKYAEAAQRYNNISYFNGFYNSIPEDQRLKFVDYAVRNGIDIESENPRPNVDVKLLVVPLPGDQMAIFRDPLQKKTQHGGYNVDSGFEIIGVDQSKRTNFKFVIDSSATEEYSRTFVRDFKLSNTNLYFYKDDAKKLTLTFDTLSIENSFIGGFNKMPVKIVANNAITLNMDAIDEQVSLTSGTGSGIDYSLKDDVLTFNAKSIGRYIILGNGIAGVSEKDPSESAGKKVEISGTQNKEIVVKNAGYLEDYTNKVVELKYYSTSDAVTGKAFPDLTINMTASSTGQAKLRITEPIPYLNGETIKLNVEKKTSNSIQQPLTITIDTVSPINLLCPQLTTFSLTSLPMIANINDYPDYSLNYLSTDGNIEVIIMEDSVKIRSNGRKSTIKKLPLSLGGTGSSGTYIHLSVDPKCNNVQDKIIFNTTGTLKFLVNEGWNRKDITGQINISGSKFFFYKKDENVPNWLKLNSNTQYIKMESDLGSANTKVPDDVPSDPNICIDNNGEMKCGETLDEVVGEETDVNLNLITSQTMDASSIDGKNFSISAVNPSTKLTLSTDSTIKSTSFEAKGVRLGFETTGDSITLEATESVSLVGVEELTSNKPVTIKAPSIEIDADLLENINQWKGALDTPAIKPKVTADLVSFDTSSQEGAQIDFSNGVAIHSGKNTFSVTSTNGRDISIAAPKKAEVTFSGVSEEGVIALSSDVRTIQMPAGETTLQISGDAYNTKVAGETVTMSVEGGQVEATEGTKYIVGVATASRITEPQAAKELHIKSMSDEGSITEALVKKDGTVSLTANGESVSIPLDNVILSASSPVTVKAEDGATGKLRYEEVNGGKVTIDESAKDNVDNSPLPDPETKPGESSSENKPGESSSENKPGESSSENKPGESDMESKPEESAPSSNGNQDNQGGGAVQNGGLTSGAIAGIVIAVLVVVAVCVVAAFFIIRKKKSNDTKESSEDSANAEI